MQVKQLQFIDDLQHVEHQLEQGGWGSERRPNQDPLARKSPPARPVGASCHRSGGLSPVPTWPSCWLVTANPLAHRAVASEREAAPAGDLNRQLGTRKAGFPLRPTLQHHHHPPTFILNQRTSALSLSELPQAAKGEEAHPHHTTPLPLHTVKRGGRAKRLRARPDPPAHLTPVADRPPPRWGSTGWWWCPTRTCSAASRRPTSARSRPRYYFPPPHHHLVARARSPTFTSAAPH